MTLMIEFTPEFEERLRRQAAALGTDPASYVRGTMEGLLLPRESEDLPRDDEPGDLDALKAKLSRGAAQADRGELLEPEAVLAKIENLKRQRAARKA